MKVTQASSCFCRRIAVFYYFSIETSRIEITFSKEQPVWVDMVITDQELNPGRTEATVALGRIVSKGYGVPAV